MKHWQYRIWWRCEKILSFTHCWREGTMIESQWKNSWAISLKTKLNVTIQLINCTSGNISQRNKNLYTHKKTYTWFFIAILFIVARNWKQQNVTLYIDVKHCSISMNSSQECGAEWIKLTSKDHIYIFQVYNIIKTTNF